MIDNALPAKEIVPAGKKKNQKKLLTQRLFKTKNFWKEDRNLDDYLDRTKLLTSSQKRTIRKLLKLRTREDGNVVKVTISGLSSLLGLSRNSIRNNLRNLEKHGFIYRQPDDYWASNGKYPVQVYVFPETFPGFEAATVFVRRGDKARHKAKQESQGKAKRPRRCRASKPSSLPVFTCPSEAPILNCCAAGKLSTKAEESKDSSPPEESITCHRTPPPAASGCRCAVAEADEEPMKSTKVNFHHEGLRKLIYDLLKQHGLQRKMLYVSNFFNRLLTENSLFKTEADKQEIAEFLYEYAIPDLISILARSHLINA